MIPSDTPTILAWVLSGCRIHLEAARRKKTLKKGIKNGEDGIREEISEKDSEAETEADGKRNTTFVHFDIKEIACGRS
ncbi:MAG: hypothetical protein Q6373_004695 [Candidatus Sigynarchaeota archaeon]